MFDKTPDFVVGNGNVSVGGFCQIPGPYGICPVVQPDTGTAKLIHVQAALDTAHTAAANAGHAIAAVAPHIAHLAHAATNLIG